MGARRRARGERALRGWVPTRSKGARPTRTARRRWVHRYRPLLGRGCRNGFVVLERFDPLLSADRSVRWWATCGTCGYTRRELRYREEQRCARNLRATPPPSRQAAQQPLPAHTHCRLRTRSHPDTHTHTPIRTHTHTHTLVSDRPRTHAAAAFRHAHTCVSHTHPLSRSHDTHGHT